MMYIILICLFDDWLYSTHEIHDDYKYKKILDVIVKKEAREIIN